MRSKLLKSFLTVAIFWWLATAFYWTVSDPMLNLKGLRGIAAMLSWLGVHLEVPSEANVLDALHIQTQVFKMWTLPLLVAAVVTTLAGVGIVWTRAIRVHKERVERVGSSGAYRGVSVTLGSLPEPQAPHGASITLRATDESLKVLTDPERALLSDVLGILAAHKEEAFAGQNAQPGTLLSNTLVNVRKALTSRNNPGLAAIVAAASELGKITAWKRDKEGAWVRTRSENRESARTLSALPSWYALDYTERVAVVFAVKYKGVAGQMPELSKDPTVYRLARSLLDNEVAVTAKAGEETPQRVFEQRDPDTELLTCFERELAVLPFQSAGMPKNIPAVGWRKNGRAYLLENRLADTLLPKLPAEVRAAFMPGARDKTARITPMTAAFLRIFAAKGWLVTEHGPDKLNPAEALWVITAGKLEFSRVIVLEMPSELNDRMPAKDSFYEITVRRPLFQSPVAAAPPQQQISKEDLMGGMLRPKSAPAAKPAETSTAPSAAVAASPITPTSNSGKPEKPS
jgi:hypothetical protein